VEFLQYGFMQRAIVAGVTVAIICPVVGLHLVLRRLPMIADGLGHVAFGGIAVGLLLQVHPIVAAAAIAALGALGIEGGKAAGWLTRDTALAVFSALGLALGIVLSKIAGGFNVDLLGFLFGSLVTVSPSDLWLILGLGGTILAVMTLLNKEFFYVTFDEESARASGLPVGMLNIVLAVLAAVTIVAAMRVVGLLLVSSLMVVPVAASLQAAASFSQALALSVGLGVLSVLVGLAAAFYLDLPAGGTIVLTTLATFVLMRVIGPRCRG
jgi:zinc transport system permease protein